MAHAYRSFAMAVSPGRLQLVFSGKSKKCPVANFFFHFSDPSENEVFWLSRIKNSRIKKSDATSEDQLLMISNFGFWSKISLLIKIIQESLFLLALQITLF